MPIPNRVVQGKEIIESYGLTARIELIDSGYGLMVEIESRDDTDFLSLAVTEIKALKLGVKIRTVQQIC